MRRDSYFARIFQRVSRRRGTAKAYVAVARKMARIMWQMLKEERAYIAKVKHTQVGSSAGMTVRTPSGAAGASQV